MKRLFWFDIKYAVGGFESIDNIITLVPPILYWMKGKTLKEVKPFFLKRKSKIIEIFPE